jgi:nucleotide-binding universal stress UspA family protein
MRKLFFGSTTERVLRETSLPVLVTPPEEVGPLTPEAIKSIVRRILVPVDLSPGAARQVAVARQIAEGVRVPLLVTHVIEAVPSVLPAKLHLLNADAERRARAESALDALMSAIPPSLKAEALVAYGDPAEEIAKIARDRKTGLIVMGLHASPSGPRMGSVTYRVLCVSPTLMLAVPPVSTSVFETLDQSAGRAVSDRLAPR